MSEIKVNKISPRTACGTTTLGDSGDTFTIPAGVTITNSGTAAGFGATGAASWDTTVKTSSPFTAVSGVGYFVNTTAGAITVNLPAGVAGDVVAIKDYANTFDTNNVTLVQNGSDKIGGSTNNAILSTEGLAVTLVFIDATQGWLVTDDGLQSQAVTNPYLVATGGTITCSGDYRIHTFTGPGTFEVTKTASAAPDNVVDYLVVAGGGGGGAGGGPSGGSGAASAGAGAGGYRESSGTTSGSYTISPLGACVSALPVSVTSYPIVIGGGGAGAARATSPTIGVNGSISSGLGITSTGGGAGAGWTTGSGQPGGSGGGPSNSCSVGSGNTPPVSPPQGNPSGTTPSTPTGNSSGGGGGGATGAGQVGLPGPAPQSYGGAGGIGGTSSITASPVGYAGGGGGGAGGDPPYTPTIAVGGSATQGGGNGGGGVAVTGVAGTTNTGGGGGGGGSVPGGDGGTGGSGIVVIRYRFQ